MELKRVHSATTKQKDCCDRVTEDVGIYRYFECAVGTGEEKCDISDYKNAGLSRKARADGLKLDGLPTCYINVRGWNMDGRCTKLSVQAHAVNAAAAEKVENGINRESSHPQRHAQTPELGRKLLLDAATLIFKE